VIDFNIIPDNFLGTGISQWCSAGLSAGWWEVRVPSLHNRVQTGSGAHPASYPVGTRGSFHGVKRLGRESNHLPPSSAEVKNVWSYISTPNTLSCPTFTFIRHLRSGSEGIDEFYVSMIAIAGPRCEPGLLGC
jgi:hypothetical protein